MKILVSACLLGVSCRYDGRDNGLRQLELIAREAELIPFCPEVYGGLPTPREPSERSGDGVVSRSGRDVSLQFAEWLRRAGLQLFCEDELEDCQKWIREQKEGTGC